jgi:hypothetical protein
LEVRRHGAGAALFPLVTASAFSCNENSGYY